MKSGMIPQHFIDDLLQRLDISDIVSRRLSLKKSGSSYKACCPFHQEKTPSFYVTPNNGSYHCFGCGTHGDAINFLREFDGLSFTEAVEELANIAGLTVPRDASQQKEFKQQQSQLSAIDTACQFYQHQLHACQEQDPAQRYLKKRGLNKEIIDHFRLGLAPERRGRLARALPDTTVKLLIDTGNISDKYGKPYEIFHNRLMFPIRNVRGKPVAFGGRTLTNDPAKYINSPESTVFHKKNEIYGLYEALQSHRTLEQLLVVEGYMDVVSLAQFGITYAVATMGTATNSDSISALLKRCSRIIFCFDGDSAGEAAAQKALANCLPIFRDGMEIKFLFLPESEDPDTLVRKEGKNLFEERVSHALTFSEFFFRVHRQGLGTLNTAESKGILRERAKEQLSQIVAPVMKNALWTELKTLTYSSNFSNSRFSHKKQKGGAVFSYPLSHSIQEQPPAIINRTEFALCLALYYNPDYAEEWLTYLNSPDEPSFTAQIKSRTTLQFCQLIRENKITTQQELLLKLATDSESRNYFYNLFNSDVLPDSDMAKQEALDAINMLKNKQRKAELVWLSAQGTLASHERKELIERSTK